MNIFYACSLFMGSAYEEIIVIPDTGSSWLIVEGHTCSNCEGNDFDYSASTTFENNAGITD